MRRSQHDANGVHLTAAQGRYCARRVGVLMIASPASVRITVPLANLTIHMLRPGNARDVSGG